MAATNIQTFAGQVEVTSNLTVDTNTLHVDSVSSRVGVGKTDPAFAMDVDGIVNATALYVGGSELEAGSPWTESDSNIYYASGNVGIGTITAPQKTLEVAGPMRITDGLSNVCDFSIGAVASEWEVGTKIVASDAGQFDNFGRSVAIDGDYAIVGAHQDDDAGGAGVNSNSGSAYIFRRTGTNTWDTGTKIVASDAADGDNFGYGVAIDGDYAIVGAYQNDDGGSSSGSAYIFRRTGTNTWDTGTKILASDAAASDRFGFSVDIDGDYAIVGAYQNDDGGSSSGSAYIHTKANTGLSVSIPIQAAGTLLSFTGQHICFPEGPVSQGLVVSANKNKYVSLNGSLTTGTRAIKSSEALPVVSLSNVANDRSVFGVVDHFEQGGTTRSQKSGVSVIRQDKELGDNRVIVNALGEGAIWVADTNGNVASGDFLTTSHLPGYAQRQDDDILRNCTVAKSTLDCDFDPERIPVQIILKDEDGKNVLDSYGRLQWMDDPEGRTAPQYRIRYLDVSGTPTDEANAVHRAAFVGCTYHCG
jgi:hypothetical protein